MVKNSNKFSFNYKNYALFNVVCYMFVILFFLVSYLIFAKVNSSVGKLLCILLLLVIIFGWMYLIRRKLEKVIGIIELEKNQFAYTTLRKTYYVGYDEVDYISKEDWIDDFVFYAKKSYVYKIKIKNAGMFSFIYYDNSLDDAIEALAKKIKIDIEDKTK